jgi:hypothetical protein
MLPVLHFNLKKICSAAYDFNRGRQTFLGHSFAYQLSEVLELAQQQKKSLDRVLTEMVLVGMTAHPIKSKALFWFAPTNDMVLLTVCDVRHQFFPMWMRDLAGYMECGSDYLPPNGRPFLYWDGSNLTRVYLKPEDHEPKGTYLCDLGALMGSYVGRGDPGAVEGVRQADPEYTVYSIVPEAPEEVLTINGRKCVLSYAFYEATGADVPVTVDGDDDWANLED